MGPGPEGDVTGYTRGGRIDHRALRGHTGMIDDQGERGGNHADNRKPGWGGTGFRISRRQRLHSFFGRRGECSEDALVEGQAKRQDGSTAPARAASSERSRNLNVCHGDAPRSAVTSIGMVPMSA